MHLGQLELCLRAGSCWKAQIADDVSQSLPINENPRQYGSEHLNCIRRVAMPLRNVLASWILNVPLWFVRRENLPLSMIANDLDVDKPTKVKLLRSEHRHVDMMVESSGLNRL